ncbi:MAG: diguanylate cyclase [Oscillospiraceae bacterium]
MKIIETFLHKYQKFANQHALLFSTAKQEIAHDNLLTLCYYSCLTIILTVTYLVLSPFLFETRNSVSVCWITILISAISAILSAFLRRKRTLNYRIVQISSAAFCVYILALLIWLSVFAYPKFPQILVGIFIVIIPSLFTLSIVFSGCLIFIGAALFCILAFYFKSPEMYAYDVFSVLCSAFFSLCVLNITIRRKIQANTSKQILKKKSTTDGLTGIYNKEAFETAAKQYVNSGLPEGRKSALFIIDIDDFKSINDTYGHKTGDKLLESFGHMLMTLFRTSDLVGRIGGDEFCVLMKSASNASVLRDKAKLVHDSAIEMSLAEINHAVTCSIGLSTTAVRSPGTKLFLPHPTPRFTVQKKAEKTEVSSVR